MGSGAVRGAGAGFNISAGFNYRFLPSTAAGIYIRRDEAYIPANLNSDDNVQFLVAGIGVTHMFTAPEAPPPPPPVAAAPAPAPEPEMPPVQKKIVLRGVNFDFDKANIRADAQPILDEAVRALGEAGDVRVSVEGHTDSVGSDAYNMGLSQRRAKAVSDYLQSKGIAGDRLTTEGFGESKPVATNETSEGRAQNRRVELRIVE
jgi:outer membrane protein OmpA-like peptidoglycan-associated protein